MDDFAKASTTALAFLRKKLGFQLCMVTLTEGNDWTVIHSDDTGYGIALVTSSSGKIRSAVKW